MITAQACLNRSHASNINTADLQQIARTIAAQYHELGWFSGSLLITHNNQPVVNNGIVGIHNGIIVNQDSLWKHHRHLERQYEVDSEIIFALLREHLSDNKDFVAATNAVFAELEGEQQIRVEIHLDRMVLGKFGECHVTVGFFSVFKVF